MFKLLVKVWNLNNKGFFCIININILKINVYIECICFIYFLKNLGLDVVM